MYLTRFGVKNYKCLGEIDIPLTPIHVLIGENDSGKTSLLEAIEIFTGSANRPLDSLLPPTEKKSELVRYHSQENEIEFTGELASSAENKTVQKILYGFAIKCSDKHVRIDIEWLGQNKDKLKPSNNKTYICKKNSGEIPFDPSEKNIEEIQIICDTLKPAQSYSFIANKLAEPAPLNLPERFKIERNGFGLAKLLDDLFDNDARTHIQLDNEYSKLFPQFKKISLDKLNIRGNGTGKRILLETLSGNTIHANMASDGALLILGYLALTYIPTPPPILLIEEPENGIYPKRLGEVIKLLKKLASGTNGIKFPQIILTTHSPYILSFFVPEEVTFLSRPPNDPDGPVRARPLSQAPNINERLADGEFYLGELWYNLSEEDLFGAP